MTLRRIGRSTCLLAALALPFAGPAAAARAAVPGAATRAAATVPGEVVVGFAPGAGRAQRVRARDAVDARLVDSGVGATQQVLQVDGDVGAAMRELRARDDVRFAEPNYVWRAAGVDAAATAVTPDDPLFDRQWGMTTVGMPATWGYQTGSAAVKVAVLDTGVDLDHPDLAAQLDRADGYDVVDGDTVPDDPNGHGTGVAGTIGAIGDNGVGVAGVAWRTSLIPYRVCAANRTCTTAAQADGLLRAGRAGAKVVNMSIEGASQSNAVDAALAQYPQMLVVVAAGNGGADTRGDDVDATPTYPCASTRPNVLCVTATDASDALAGFSNFGAVSVDLAAPGDGIWTTGAAGTYASMRGTSFAAPFVTGVAALAWSANPLATMTQVRSALRNAVDPVPGLAGKVASGGRLDAFATLRALDREGPASTISGGPADATNATTARFTLTASETPATFECRVDGVTPTVTTPTDALGLLSATPSAAADPLGAPAALATDDGTDWQACTAAPAVTVSGDGQHLLEVRASDGLGNVGPVASRAWTLDRRAPDLEIESVPQGTVDRRTATVTFTTDEPADVTCAIDGTAAQPCTSPAEFPRLGDGSHTLVLRATDRAGNLTTTSRSWRVDAAPATDFTSGPAPIGTSPATVFTWTAVGATGFECRQDDGPAWQPCTSPLPVGPVDDGAHVLRVRALDGIHEPNEISERHWVVDTTPPTLELRSAPSGLVATRAATLTFDLGIDGTTECRVDGGDARQCPSPWVLTGLADGPHTATIRARDALGNAREVNATWSVDATGPALAFEGDTAELVTDSIAFNTDAGAVTTCAVDGAAFRACTSPVAIGDLGPGAHVLTVRAADALGNVTELRHPFTVGAGGPGATGPAALPATVAAGVADLLRARRTPARLARASRLALRVRAPAAGSLRVAITLRTGSRVRTLFTGSRRFTRASTATIRLAATSDLRRIRRARSAKLRISARFDPRRGRTSSATRTVTLRRR